MAMEKVAITIHCLPCDLGDIRIGANNTGWCPLDKTRRSVARVFHFHTVETLRHLFKCTTGITADMSWMVVELAEALRSRAVRALFSLRKLAQIIPCNFSSKMIHSMYVQRLRQNNNQSDILFWFKINTDVQSLVCIVMFHALNVLVNVLLNILYMNIFN